MDWLRVLIAAFLCPLLCVPPPMVFAEGAQANLGESGPVPTARQQFKPTQLQGDERILQALNRFTFGPRPGDLEAVRAMGLNRWFDEQLHPSSIDETGLDARLAQFPAMQWSTQDLLFRIPSNAIIRQAMNGKIEVPSQRALHAVYEDAIYRMQTKKTEKQNKNTAAPANQPAASTLVPGMDTGSSPPANANSGAPAGAPAGAPGPLPDPQAMALAARMDAFDEDPATTEILALPPQQRVARLQAMQPADFEAFIQSLRPPRRAQLTADMTPDLKETVDDLENPERLVVEELMADRLARDIYSNAQLREVMTDFWLNHFNIFLRKDEQMPYYLVSFERDSIRPHALGKFEDLLEAVAHSPAMLIYLDNATSIGPDSPAAERAKFAAWRRPAKAKAPDGLNENYARELMELHTLGVNGGYTQADVIQVARVLTGWTVDRPQLGGGFVFNPMRHEPGAKKVLGVKIKENGEMEGRELLHMLALRPATAQFLSRELAVRFVSDDPPQSLVDRMAKTYLASGGDIPAVLKALFRSPEFWSTGVYRAKVKTPLEFVVSAARASNADVRNYLPLDNALRQMGMPLYGCVPPSGYSWESSTWVSTGALVDRMNFALNLAAGRFPGVTVQLTPEAAPDSINASSTAETVPSTPREETRLEETRLEEARLEEARLEPLLLPGGVSPTTRAAALDEFERQNAHQSAPAFSPARAAFRANSRRAASPLERQDQLLAGLLIGSPEFQRR